MTQTASENAQIYARITDTIFAVIMGLSFKEYHWLLAPPDPSLKLAILIFAYLVVVVSRVGYHKSISSNPYKGSKRFFADLWILYMYFVLTFAAGGRNIDPSILTAFSAQVGVFAGYLIWDLLKKHEYPEFSTTRIITTIVCFLLTLAILVIFCLPIFPNGDMILGGYLKSWILLLCECGVMALFWTIKLS